MSGSLKQALVGLRHFTDKAGASPLAPQASVVSEH